MIKTLFPSKLASPTLKGAFMSSEKMKFFMLDKNLF
jgi:hypothetical protein